eukprot:jgi/Mesvir1/15171/Mv08190-RA.1
MASAIMQLHARGSQDIATIVNPEVTFWKTVYPRHTNFAWDDTFITQSTGLSDYGQLIEFKLPRSGDLVTKCTLYMEMSKLNNWAGCFYRGIYGNEMSQMIQELGHMKYVNWVIEYAMFADKHQFHERVSPGVMLYTIPLCIQPDAWKPSGSLNLSRLDDVKLVLKKMGGLPPGSIHVYAKSYNVIKIQNGMGGKRYAS